MMDNPEHALLKELRNRYRNKYKFLKISLGRNGGYDLNMSYDGRHPQIQVIFIENGDQLRVKLAKHITQRSGGDSVALASPHMMTKLDSIVQYSVIEYIKHERESRINTSKARTDQISDLKHQVERLNTDVKRMASIIKMIGGLA